jgi:hypothetical protein
VAHAARAPQVLGFYNGDRLLRENATIEKIRKVLED